MPPALEFRRHVQQFVICIFQITTFQFFPIFLFPEDRKVPGRRIRDPQLHRGTWPRIWPAFAPNCHKPMLGERNNPVRRNRLAFRIWRKAIAQVKSLGKRLRERNPGEVYANQKAIASACLCKRCGWDACHHLAAGSGFHNAGNARSARIRPAQSDEAVARIFWQCSKARRMDACLYRF